MTDKKESILSAALELFANEGYAATPTSKIAKTAGVSEGLIFRHFENKQGLLKALNQEAEAKLIKMYTPVLFESDPKLTLRKLIELPFQVDKSELDFWKLQFKLKWQKEYYNPNKMKPILDKMTIAFEELGYEEPEKEAVFLNFFLNGLATEILQGKIETVLPLKPFLLKKYKV